MEARLAALQTASTNTHTHLTRVRLALVNIYSVARAYQHSLPALGPKASTAIVLKRLHNFLLDAKTVTTIARATTHPASLRPSASSVAKPIGKGSAISVKKEVSPRKSEGDEKPVDAWSCQRSVNKKQGKQTTQEQSKTMKIKAARKD